MKIDKLEWNFENDRLQTVIKEIRRQLDEKRSLKEKFKKDTLETQRDLWEDLGSVTIANGLEQVVDFMQFINSMKIHKRSHEFTRILEGKYQRMLSSPYFGRIDFIEDKETEAEKCYIGVSNLISDNYDFLIYDWRAPISSMFYDFEIGNGSYKCPDGIVTGKITKKRQYKIDNGKIQYMFDSNLNIDDEVLQEILSKSTDTKMKAIVTTIQREQNKVIRDEKYKNLIVQGPAGSGKTSVALHRIGYLLYKHRDKITAQNIVVFSPNNIFNDYISNVLPQLGEDNMCQTTFKEYMHSFLGDELIKEDYCDMMEYLLTNNKYSYYLIRVSSIRFKASMEFVFLLREYVSYLEEMNREFEDIVVAGRLIISSKGLQELFYKDYLRFPLKRRLEKMGERIIFLMEPYENSLIQEVTDKIDRITKLDIVEIYKCFYENLDFLLSRVNIQYDDKEINEIKSYTLESLKNGKLNYEDQIAILYLKGAIGDMPKTSEIKYVIIDEA